MERNETNDQSRRFSEFILGEFDKFKAAYRKAHATRRDPSQNEFARWLGISPAGLSLWINGPTVPSDDNLTRMAAKLGNEVFIAAGRYRNPFLAPIVLGFDELDEADQRYLLSEFERKRREAHERDILKVINPNQ